MIVDHYFHHSFLFFFSSPSQPFLIERLFGSKTYIAKVGESAQKSRRGPLIRKHRPFFGPLAAFFVFVGVAWVPPSLQGWHLSFAGIFWTSATYCVFNYNLVRYLHKNTYIDWGNSTSELICTNLCMCVCVLVAKQLYELLVSVCIRPLSLTSQFDAKG